ncbi:hypothetical protein [Nocardiopsis alba]|uniref:hypothetical protein n=1 Tax=Nocardiopsis alba TaxID=53437 RepID=UPI0003490B26|nr:hypothetical protein [Nocardiopsis alba]
MRKHHKRWVALLGAAAISTSGLVGLAGTAAADDRDAQAFAWPMIEQGTSSYSIDGYEIGYLPPELGDYGINATSTTDRHGDRESRVSWVRGPDQLYARVGILRSERVQDLEDLRESRYSHLSKDSLEALPESETFPSGAYLSEETGDLFWVEEPGIAVTTHLRPELWDRAELLRMAEAVAPLDDRAAIENVPATTEEPAAETVAVEPVTEEAAAEAVSEEVSVEETPAEEAAAQAGPASGQGEVETPAEQAPAEETAVEETAVEETAVEEGQAEAPTEEVAEEAPAQEGATEVTAPEAPAEESESEGVGLPEGVTSREVKTCLIERFVDLDTGESRLDRSRMTPTAERYLDEALAAKPLDDTGRDRLLATVWYYGDEGDKVAATDDCAQRFSLRDEEVEGVLGQVSDLIAGMVRDAEEVAFGSEETTEEAPAEAPVEEVAPEATDTAEGTETTTRESAEQESPELVIDPIGAAEWNELLDSLPWSLPGTTR